MAATTQVQILVRTNSSWEELGAWYFGQCPWACLQGQLAHDRAPEMLEPLGLPVKGQHTPDRAKGVLAGAARQRRVCMRFSRGHWPQCPGTLVSDNVITCGASLISSPHRRVVRTSRCGRDNPGSNPGADRQLCEGTPCSLCWSAPWRWEWGGCPVLSVQQSCTSGLRGTATCACPSSAAGGATWCWLH